MHLLAALGQQVLWPGGVELKVPLLLHNVRMDGCQGGANTRLVARTDGAATAVHSVIYPGLPDMLMPTSSCLAQPPDFVIGATGDICRRCVIEGGVPLRSYRQATLRQRGPPCAPHKFSSR